MNRNLVINFLKTLSPTESFYQLCQEKQYTADEIRSIQSMMAIRPVFLDGTPIPPFLLSADITSLPQENSVHSIGEKQVVLLRHERNTPRMSILMIILKCSMY